MKNSIFLFALVILSLLSFTSCDPDPDFTPNTSNSNYDCPDSISEQARYIPMPWDQAPELIRNFVNNNYPGITPTMIKVDDTDPNDYEVYLRAQNMWISLEFEDGRLEQNRVVGFFLDNLPEDILNCINTRWPNAIIQLSYVEADGDIDVYILYQGFIYELDFDRSSLGNNNSGNPAGPANCTLEQEDQYQPLTFGNLSGAIQQYLNSNFPGQNPALMLRETDDNDTEVYILENQQWRSLEFEGNNLVRNSIEGNYIEQIPDWISNCIQQAFPNSSVQLIYRENDGDYTIYILTGTTIREISLEL